MVWAKLDDAILDNPKIARAGVFGFALHVAAITWSCRNLTDGHVEYSRVTALLTLQRVHFDVANPLALLDGNSSMGGEEGLDPYIIADHLVDCGLWERTGTGYVIHDFLIYNPSREQVLAKRRQDAERAETYRKSHPKKKSPRESRRESRETSRVSPSLPDPVPVPNKIREPSAQDRHSETRPVAPAKRLRPGLPESLSEQDVENERQRQLRDAASFDETLRGRTGT
jgi:hypothetical protein